MAVFDKEVNYYEFLSVDPKADTKTIRRAYLDFMRVNHPDVNPDPKASDRCATATKIKDVLLDEYDRADYDRFLLSDKEIYNNRNKKKGRGNSSRVSDAPVGSDEYLSDLFKHQHPDDWDKNPFIDERYPMDNRYSNYKEPADVKVGYINSREPFVFNVMLFVFSLVSVLSFGSFLGGSDNPGVQFLSFTAPIVAFIVGWRKHFKSFHSFGLSSLIFGLSLLPAIVLVVLFGTNIPFMFDAGIFATLFALYSGKNFEVYFSKRGTMSDSCFENTRVFGNLNNSKFEGVDKVIFDSVKNFKNIKIYRLSSPFFSHLLYLGDHVILIKYIEIFDKGVLTLDTDNVFLKTIKTKRIMVDKWWFDSVSSMVFPKEIKPSLIIVADPSDLVVDAKDNSDVIALITMKELKSYIWSALSDVNPEVLNDKDVFMRFVDAVNSR